MPKIVDVAKYILHKTCEITTMRLHKLCYYSQGWTLAWTEEPLFKEDFMAFACGPVCDELLKLHKGVFVLRDGDLGEYDPCALNEDESDYVDAVLKGCLKYLPFQLTEIVHQETPWIEARGDLKLGKKCKNIISKESMFDFFTIECAKIEAYKNEQI
ncbi:MAG: DUF4065 domain-containing protein [Clostridiales bacterium]|nr:DUF4065 domain-containing protein [Clostridiales bacterium]